MNKHMNRHWVLMVVALALGLVATGCSNKKLLNEQEMRITTLESEVDSLSTVLDTEMARAAQINDELERSLADHRAQERVWIEEVEGLTRITLDGEVSFPSGSARVNEIGSDILDRIWNVLSNYPDREILIEGHTDNVPIAERWQHNYKSNWELSSARAHAVLHYAVRKYAADPTRIAAVGYGEFRPIASNDSQGGRSTNRRVVITVGSRSNMMKAMP